MTGVAIVGATGRMGRALIAAVSVADGLSLAQAVVRPGSDFVGRDAGELAGVGTLGVTCEPALTSGDVAIEFSGPTALGEIVDAAQRQAIPLVSGSTGLDADQQDLLATAAERLPILWAPNMSLGVQWLYRLVEDTAKSLGESADIEIVDWHHAGKRDAPSGTARALGEAAARARGQDPAEVLRTDRHGENAPRVPGEIGVTAVRAGDIIGEHTVHFGLPGERIELTHRATSRDVFVQGALAAARFLPEQPAGLYGLGDLLQR